MESKLNLNLELVAKARASASKVADDVQQFIDVHTTVTVERAVCRLLGIDGVNDVEVPLPNVVVDHMLEKGILPGGAAFYIGNAMAEYHCDPQTVAEKVNAGEIDLSRVPVHTAEEIRAAIMPVVNATLERINQNVATRNEFLKEFGDKVPADEKSAIESKIADLRSALGGNDAAAIKAKSDDLQQAFYALSSKVYQQNGGQPGADPNMGGSAGFNSADPNMGGNPNGGSGDDGVVDADFKEV